MAGLGPGQSRERDLSWHDYSQMADLSEDGRLAVFTESGDAGGKRGVTYLRKMDGSPAIPLGEGLFASLSPDSRSVASVGQPNDVFLLPTGSGQPQKLTYARFESIKRVAWFPDGRTLLLAAIEPAHSVRLYVQALGGGDARVVAPEGIDINQCGKPISPDGRTIAAIDPDGRVLLVGVDGSAPHPAAGVEKGEVPIGWTNDGKGIYVFRRGQVPGKIFRVDVATGRRTAWKELGPDDVTGVIGLADVVVSPDGRSFAYSYFRNLSDLYIVDGVK